MAKELKENMRIMFYQIKNINAEIKIIKWNQQAFWSLEVQLLKVSLEGLNSRFKWVEESANMRIGQIITQIIQSGGQK